MKTAGIDIGSRSVKLIVLDCGEIVHAAIADTGYDPRGVAQGLLEEAECELILATGYGRNIAQLHFKVPTVTEIKAHARGAWQSSPGCRTVLDIGGQDTKVIALTAEGKVAKFEMNDRCAAGTGKFLEIMASNLGFSLEIFGSQALQAEEMQQISSMCTVFAESEVTSAIAGGADRREIAKGLHMSVVRRAAAMLKRVSVSPRIAFTGGAAKNECLHHLLQEELGQEIDVPDNPEMTGALGAALLAEEEGHRLEQDSA
jgi:predicted CoA-substrate-specific enzyme activase